MRTAELPATPLPVIASQGGDWCDYLALLKPRVMSLVIFTGAVGLIAAPHAIHPVLAFTAILAIAIGAGAAGALNQWWEADLDVRMRRTASRPIPSGRVAPADALGFGLTLAVGSVALMYLAINAISAALLALTIVFYAVVYTMWLKPRTPYNIVIGGAAGAFPPLIGWVAATGTVDALPLILFAIIFMWTPPHFWALALFVRGDYANAGVPMLPVTAGARATRRQILFYSVALVATSLAPVALGLLGLLYAFAAVTLGATFLALAVAVARNGASEAARMAPEKRLFAFSLVYLFALFAAVAADRLAQ